MKQALLLFLVLCYASCLVAQTMINRNAFIGFYSKTPLEDIKAENKQVVAAIDLQKKSVAFIALLRSFLFRKELMQQHFNENYVESDKYPKASFNGTFIGNVDIKRNGKYPIQVSGNLTLHGVTRSISIPAFFVVENDKLFSSANFQLVPSDFNIKIPAVVRDKITEKIDVAVKVEYPINQ